MCTLQSGSQMPSWAVWSLGCHNDSLVLLVFFEDIHIRAGSSSVFWVAWSSSWHPKERLDLTYVMLSAGTPSKGYNAGSFWLGTAQLGLARLRLAFPSIPNFNEWQRSLWAVLISGYRDDDLDQTKNILRKVCAGLRQKQNKTEVDLMDTTNLSWKQLGERRIKLLKVHPTNPVNPSTAAAMSIIL